MAVNTPSTTASAEQLFEQSLERSLVRISTAGSVDDGKSTLIGRLLYDSKSIYEDQLTAISEDKKSQNVTGASLALLTDGLRAEREQGITIDVAYRFFSTPKRHFILADTPGHEQYTRNMATGASNAHVAVILVDAMKGVLPQSRRHAFIASLLGVPRFVLAINKMDLVGYSQQRFEEIRDNFLAFATRLSVKQITAIPVSALLGDNIVSSSENMPWYHGETLLEYLENVYIDSDQNLVDFRLPVQYVIRDGTYRGYTGQIASGTVSPGEEITVLPSMQKTRIASVLAPTRGTISETVEKAFPPMSVTVTLEDEVDVARGDMLVRSKNVPVVRREFEAMLVWMSETPLRVGDMCLIRHTTREARVQIENIEYKVDVNTLGRESTGELQLNEIGRVAFTATKPLFLDSYLKNRGTGGFILIDPNTFGTAGAGLVIERMPGRGTEHTGVEQTQQESHTSQNIQREHGEISRRDREARAGFPATTLWFTGLSGSGKSTLAKELEHRMFAEGRPVYRLDGDNLRFGLNRDLGFSMKDRSENIRRAAEVARLFNEAGITVLCSFISPYRRDRELARSIIGAQSFLEVHVATPIEECEARDPKGLYQKARTGEISEFTGVSSPYEAPEAPEVRIDTTGRDSSDCVAELMRYLEELDGKWGR